jgi:hypothetical protein
MNELWERELHQGLQRCGIQFHRGLSETEVDEIQRRYGFQFPPDLKSFLEEALPVSRGFPDWRDGSEADLKDSLAWPLEGILFDVEHNGFWMPAWGERPTEIEQAIEVARTNVSNAPQLIPIYSHRYIPSEPLAGDNPVFSVYQADILRFRSSLRSCLTAEFCIGAAQFVAPTPRRIRFWDELVCFNREAGRGYLQIA